MQNIVSQFAIRGTVSEIKPLGEGLINDTYKVTTVEPDAPDYVLQRINTNVFPDPDMVMRNIKAVTSHIRQKLEAKREDDIDRKVLTFIPSKADPEQLYVTVPSSSEEGMQSADCEGKVAPPLEGTGGFWRLMIFIPNAITKQAVNPDSSRAAGKAFGQFQAMLADIPVELGETIKDFHNMEFRLEQLRQALKDNLAGRADEPEVKDMVEQIKERADEMCKAERLYREGKLPKRVCHCDTKVNNMMFDQQDNVLCVIDLDTVMPNFIFSDYGDFLRTGANKVAEDHDNMAEVQFDVDIFKAFTEGYLSSAKSFLLPIEIENLPYATALFPYMQCVRFLWDYLNGDKYWKVKYPTHNFVRANNQLHLLLSIEEHWGEMKEFIQSKL